MKRFEYTCIVLGFDDNDDEMNRLGKEGWELVGLNRNFAYFKREL